MVMKKIGIIGYTIDLNSGGIYAVEKMNNLDRLNIKLIGLKPGFVCFLFSLT